MINENWTRWIISSIRKHFNDRKQNWTLLFEGQQKSPEEISWAELRWNGPFYRQDTRIEWYSEIIISVMISATMTKDLDLINKMIGTFQSAYESTIVVRKYGDNVSTDDASVLGCLEIIDQGNDTVITNNFGQRGPDERILQTEIVAAYKMYLTSN